MAGPTVTASVEVRMPQMGETVTEGTITSWLKDPGDTVAADCHVPYEPTLEAAVLPQVADVETAARDLLTFE